MSYQLSQTDCQVCYSVVQQKERLITKATHTHTMVHKCIWTHCICSYTMKNVISCINQIVLLIAIISLIPFS